MFLTVTVQPDGTGYISGRMPAAMVTALLAAAEDDVGRTRHPGKAYVNLGGSVLITSSDPGRMNLHAFQRTLYPYWLETAPDEWREYPTHQQVMAALS